MKKHILSLLVIFSLVSATVFANGKADEPTPEEVVEESVNSSVKAGKDAATSAKKAGKEAADTGKEIGDAAKKAGKEIGTVGKNFRRHDKNYIPGNFYHGQLHSKACNCYSRRPGAWLPPWLYRRYR